MSEDFISPILQDSAEQLKLFGYQQVHSQEGWDQQGNYINMKVFHCQRNGLQVILQTTKSPTLVEGIWENLNLSEEKQDDD